MNRSVKKYLEEYKNDTPGKKDKFYKSDISQIMKISNGDLFETICNSLNFGFMVGYKFAQNQNKYRKGANKG